VVAISEGRRLFANIQRFVLHLLTTNIAEVMLLIIGLCFLDDQGTSVFPLSPIAILWVNMITSGPPAFGLGLEKASLDSMRRPPHRIKDGVFSWPVIIDTVAYGLVMGITSLLSVSNFHYHSKWLNTQYNTSSLLSSSMAREKATLDTIATTRPVTSAQMSSEPDRPRLPL
jgi:magnesium-transporting ATPase (P-type)